MERRSRFAGPIGEIPETEAPIKRLFRGRAVARYTCSGLQCQSVQTSQCAYTDRHGKACETRWCRRHVQTAHRKPYCPVHIVSAQPGEYGDHRVARVLDWLGRAVDDDLVALMRPVAAAVEEGLRAEPVRFGQVGPQRDRLWERCWKTYSELGVGCRVSLAIEDRNPDLTYVRVNSSVVNTFMTPWAAANEMAPVEVSDRIAPTILRPVAVALNVWLNNAQVQLRGAPLPPI